MTNIKEEFQESIKNWMSVSIHTFMSRMHTFAKQNNLSFTQMNCLFKMNRHGPLQVSQVSTFFDISNPAASQLLDKLVHMDLVIRTESSTDRRVKFHNVTNEGKDLINDFFISVKHLHSELVDSFDKEDYKTGRNLLDTLTNNLLELSGHNKKENKCSKL